MRHSKGRAGRSRSKPSLVRSVLAYERVHRAPTHDYEMAIRASKSVPFEQLFSKASGFRGSAGRSKVAADFVANSCNRLFALWWCMGRSADEPYSLSRGQPSRRDGASCGWARSSSLESGSKYAAVAVVPALSLTVCYMQYQLHRHRLASYWRGDNGWK
jgi:hypothetical protein